MGKVIFLNGCGSSGKTSVARSIQHLSNEPWLTFGIDAIIDMLPPTKQDEYFKFAQDSNEYGSTMRVDVTPMGIEFFRISTSFASLLAHSNNVIIDEVILNDNDLKQYAAALEQYTVYYVGIICNLQTMQEREILRSNRHIGLSADQINRVHTDGLRSNYDLRVDTTNLSPFDAARQILSYVESEPYPQSFKMLK